MKLLLIYGTCVIHGGLVYMFVKDRLALSVICAVIGTFSVLYGALGIDYMKSHDTTSLKQIHNARCHIWTNGYEQALNDNQIEGWTNEE